MCALHSVLLELQPPQLSQPIQARRLRLLADRTNGRATGTVLRRSVVCTECIVAKRCVLEQKLLLRAYRKSYYEKSGTKMKDLDLRLEVVPRPSTVLHSTLNIAETVRDRGLVPNDYQQEMAYAGLELSGSWGMNPSSFRSIPTLAYGLSNGHATNDVTAT